MNVEQVVKKNKEIISKYPFLQIQPEYYESTYLDCIPLGWHDLVLQMCADISKQCNLQNFQILEMKEKYGELRIYHTGDQLVERIISDYSFISGYVCAICGKPNTPMVYDNWIEPFCKKCWTKHINSKAKYEDLIKPEEINIPYQRMVKQWDKDKNEWKEISYNITHPVKRYIASWNLTHKT